MFMQSFILISSLIYVSSEFLSYIPVKCEPVKKHARNCDADGLGLFKNWSDWDVVAAYIYVADDYNRSRESGHAFPQACPELHIIKYEENTFYYYRTLYEQDKRRIIAYEKLLLGKKENECGLWTDYYKRRDVSECSRPYVKRLSQEIYSEKDHTDFHDGYSILGTDNKTWIVLWFCRNEWPDEKTNRSSQTLHAYVRSSASFEEKLELQRVIMNHLSTIAYISKYVYQYDLKKCFCLKEDCKDRLPELCSLEETKKTKTSERKTKTTEKSQRNVSCKFENNIYVTIFGVILSFITF